LGVNWAGTLLGCVAAIMIPIPVLFYLYGKRLRERSKFAPTFAPLHDEMPDGGQGDSD
jgi:MFS transporter, DHA1 family, multidrug resistance protein